MTCRSPGLKSTMHVKWNPGKILTLKASIEWLADFCLLLESGRWGWAGGWGTSADTSSLWMWVVILPKGWKDGHLALVKIKFKPKFLCLGTQKRVTLSQSSRGMFSKSSSMEGIQGCLRFWLTDVNSAPSISLGVCRICSQGQRWKASCYKTFPLPPDW